MGLKNTVLKENRTIGGLKFSQSNIYYDGKLVHLSKQTTDQVLFFLYFLAKFFAKIVSNNFLIFYNENKEV